MKSSQRALILSVFSLVLLFSHRGATQTVDIDSDSKGFSELRQSGKLVTIELAPEGKELRLKLIGHDAADVKLNKFSLEATYGFGKVKNRLTVTKKDGEYVILRKKIEPIDLNIRVRTQDQVEDFDFRLK